MHGISFGLALDMSLACDIRISTTDTRFSVKEVDIGLAADIGKFTYFSVYFPDGAIDNFQVL